MIILILFLSITSVSDCFVKFIYKEILLKNMRLCYKSQSSLGELEIKTFNRLKDTLYQFYTDQPEYSKCLLSEVSLLEKQVIFSVESIIINDWFKDIFHCFKQFIICLILECNPLQMGSHVCKYNASAATYHKKEFRNSRKFNIKDFLASDALMFQPPYNIGEAATLGFRQKRYTLFKYKWKKRNLTYCITKYAKSLPRNVVDREISRAFRLWTSVTTLTITETKTNDADILLGFEKGMHGDTVPFDGPGAVLAHTYYPIMLLDGSQKSFIHFDDTERWTTYSKSGTNLYQVAVHEIGHALGLKHSLVEDSVMWPGHKGYKINFTLHQDDIRGIQALYGLTNLRRT